MKTIRIAATALMVCLFSNVYAQYALQTGKFQFNGGIGLSSWGLPVYAGLDYGFDKNISFGGSFRFDPSMREFWASATHRALLALRAMRIIIWVMF
jgi:hypothetical protein